MKTHKTQAPELQFMVNPRTGTCPDTEPERVADCPVAERVWGLWLWGRTPKTRWNSGQAAAREALTVGQAKEEPDENQG